MTATAKSVDTAEIEHFSALADRWWDERGPFAPLHRINPVRVGYLRDRINAHYSDVKGKTLLDIGCGGGLVCEPLARLGAAVTGLDASEKNIEAAKLHAGQSSLSIDYRCAAAETLAAEGKQFDVVLALEIVEHVADVSAFVDATCKLVKPGGLIIYSTLNRTVKSFALGIVAAEYVLRWIPKGTHDWQKFIKPSELAVHLRRNHIDIVEMTGLTLNPIERKWQLSPRDLGVNYFITGRK